MDSMKKVVIFLLFFLGGLAAAGPAGDSASAATFSLKDKRALFTRGVKQFRAQQYTKALQAFQSLQSTYPELDDYVLYFLAKSYQARESRAKALELFQRFLKQYPAHPLSDTVRFAQANILFELGRYEEALEDYQALLTDSTVNQASLLYQAGFSFLHTGRREEAAAAFYDLIRRFPENPLATTAQTTLNLIVINNPELKPAWTEDQVLEHADALFDARLYNAAIKRYQAFQQQYPKSLRRGESQFRIADAYFRSGKEAKGKELLDQIVRSYIVSQPELAAQALYTIGRKQWEDNYNEEAKQHLRKIITDLPKTSRCDDACYVLGRIYQSEKAYAESAEWYSTLYTQHHQSSFAEEAMWRAGWSYYLAGDDTRALEHFSLAMTTFPAGDYCSASLYWRARSLERQQSVESAMPVYRELAETSPASYYGILAHKRLQELKVEIISKPQHRGNHPELPILVRQLSQKVDRELAQELTMRAGRVMELNAVQLSEYARTELEWLVMRYKRPEVAEKGPLGQASVLYLLGRLYSHIGDHLTAMHLAPEIESVLKKAEASRFPYALERLSYPLDYWDLIRKHAARHDLDPFLVAAIIRQESCYNPKAVSCVRACGLMQVMPGTGKMIAGQLGLKHYTQAHLYDADTNIQIGTAYLASLIKRYEGNIFRAIAAYNAGPTTTRKWWLPNTAVMPEEVVENITYRATRQYVKCVLRNQYWYRTLYQDVSSASSQTSGSPRGL